MNNKYALSISALITTPWIAVYANDVSHSSYVIAGYRFPAALYGMLQSGLELPISLDNAEAAKAEDKYIQIGHATLYITGQQLVLRNIRISSSEESKIQLSEKLLAELKKMDERTFDSDLRILIDKDAWFTFEGRQMRLMLSLNKKGFGTLIVPREYDIDDPSTTSASGTIGYGFGGYTTQTSQGQMRNSGYLNFNSTTSLGVDHLLLNGSVYSGNSFSSDRNGRVNAILWERDYKGFRSAAGVLDSWNMQSLGSVSALTGGEVYGLSIGNVVNSRKRDSSLSLTPVVAFFPTAGEARIRRDGNLLSIQHFPVGSHEIDTSMLPYGNYTVEVEVASGDKRISNEIFQINKPFTAEASESIKWQFWGGVYDRNKINNYRYNRYDDEENQRTFSDKDKEQMFLAGLSLGKNHGTLSWNTSAYMLREHGVAEVWASRSIINWLSVNTQLMSATDGSWRGNYGGLLNLPFSIGNIWYNRNRLYSGNFLSLYENRGDNWGISGNLPTLGPASSGVITWSEDRDVIYGYKRRRLDYSQGLYAGRYGSVRLRAGRSYNNNNNNHSSSGSEQESYVMLDFSIPLGNSIAVGISHSRESGSMMNIDSTHSFQGDYLKSISANLSKSFSGGSGGRDVTGGGMVGFDTPYNTNALSFQTDNAGGWNSTLTSQGSLAWAGTHIGAGQGRDSAGVLIDTGLQRGEKLMLDIDGTRYPLSGNRNYVALSPYAQYKIELMNNADTLESYDIIDGGRQELSLYPGNVVYLQPQIKKIITVSGRLINKDGTVAAHREIKNRMGLAQSDMEGRFVIDVDSKDPQLAIATKDNSVCSLKLDLTQSDGALWLGDIYCEQKEYVWQQRTPQRNKNNEKTGS